MYRALWTFFTYEVWERRLDELSPGRALLYRTARILQRCLAQVIVGDVLATRAAALTYFTVLSLVPFLAIAFAILKGFDAHERFVQEALLPYVLGLVSGNDALRKTFEKILIFVEQTSVASLGFAGLLTLLYAATRLQRNVELAFNDIWEIRASRSIAQQLRDYLAILIVTPLCLMAGTATLTTAQSIAGRHALEGWLPFGTLLEQSVAVVAPLAAVFLGLLFLYKVMPYTPVRMRSAALGAALGSALWYAVLVVHVRFQVGVANYNALYSSFAAIPIFLAWLQASWFVVLIGALVAATHQNVRGLAQRIRLASVDQALKETVAIAALLHVARSFLYDRPPCTLRALGKELDVHEPLLEEVLNHLARADIVARAESQREARYLLARPPEHITMQQVLDALRRSPALDEAHAARGRLGEEALGLYRALEDALRQSPANRSLEQIVRDLPRPESARDRS